MTNKIKKKLYIYLRFILKIIYFCFCHESQLLFSYRFFKDIIIKMIKYYKNKFNHRLITFLYLIVLIIKNIPLF